MTDLTCTQVEQAATEYALGILPPDEARAVSAHVRHCPACRREVDDIRRIGDRLLDLVADVEPPLGFDQRVLSNVRSHPGPRRATPPATAPATRPGKRRLLAVVAAAVVAVIAAFTATALYSERHYDPPAEVTGVLHSLPQTLEGTHDVGTIYIGGHPPWISVTVDHLPATGTVSCELIYRDGTIADLGTFPLVAGRGTWGAPGPAGAAQPTAARLVGPTGMVLATAPLSPG